MSIGEIVKKIRTKMEMSQKQFAEVLKCNQSTVARYEEGVRVPNFASLTNIIEVAKKNKVKVKLEDFMGEG